MLHYGLSENFIKHLAAIPYDQRIELLWKAQGLLSHVPGYLRKKVDENGDELFFEISDDALILMHDSYDERILADFVVGKNNKGLLNNSSSNYKESIVVLLKPASLEKDYEALLSPLKENHFPAFFISLLALLPLPLLGVLLSKEVFKEAKEEIPPEEEKEEEKEGPIVASAKEVEKKSQIIKHYQNSKKHDVDGEKFEKEILKQLAKGYELRKKTQKHVVKVSKPLSHVRFAPREIIVAFTTIGECLFLLDKRTRKYGCRLSNDSWKILLALNIPENIYYKLESRYPKHVLYTDDPNKGDLNIAFIVKYAKEKEKEDELEVKRVTSKTANFQNNLPSGAFENIDEDELIEYASDSSFKPFVSKNVVHISNETKIEQIEEEMEDFFEDDFETLDFVEEENLSSPTLALEESKATPKHWNCFLCGKKKTYVGEPAETVKMASGKIVYLCKKHRGKM